MQQTIYFSSWNVRVLRVFQLKYANVSLFNCNHGTHKSGTCLESYRIYLRLNDFDNDDNDDYDDAGGDGWGFFLLKA
jgi:hypothetical protein